MIDLSSDYASPPSTSHPLFTDTAGAYDPYTGYNPPTNNAMRNDLAASHSTELSPFIPLVPNRLGVSAVQRTPSAESTGQDVLTPFDTSSKTPLVLSNDAANAPAPQPQAGHSPSDSRQDTSPLLTDEQADFINSLHHNNVPAAAIARVMERMLADRHAGIREWERETRLARTNTMTTAPPSYDLVAERG